MPNVGAERDLERSKELRKTAGTIKDATAKRQTMDAADRLERRAGRKLSKIGRKRPASRGLPAGRRA